MVANNYRSNNRNCNCPIFIRIPLAYKKTSRRRYCCNRDMHHYIYSFLHRSIITTPPKEIKVQTLNHMNMDG
ncbi:hypothetical protein BFAG_00046 [Bacteroides fragilis 3_1_12]|uniref:Transposase n=1 Tax=Bacteroides fragilis 3_1_12 TaxID=457424 RepID=A0ABN0BE98_BACFG|nr:hypothetical protein BFAG_00046 [Bacteroides fragilis 3_1_12]